MKDLGQLHHFLASLLSLGRLVFPFTTGSTHSIFWNGLG